MGILTINDQVKDFSIFFVIIKRRCRCSKILQSVYYPKIIQKTSFTESKSKDLLSMSFTP